MDPLSVRIGAAYLTDLVVGDPRWLPHPVRWIGGSIQRAEAVWRVWLKNEHWAGLGLVATIAGGTLAAAAGLVWAAHRLSPAAGAAIEILLLFFCFSTRDLAIETLPVARALEAGDLPLARKKVSWIVGRDTRALSEPEVVRAAVETVAESTMDGIVAPLFYAALGGAPLACLYKAVNTLDSMVGFRSARYLRLGRAAATLDRWMNCLPAHLTVFFLAAAGQLIRGTGVRSLRVAYRDGWPSRENSYLTEAAMAGVLSVQVGGENFYQGVPAMTPRMGDPDRPLQPPRVIESLRVMGIASLLALAAVFITRGVWAWLR